MSAQARKSAASAKSKPVAATGAPTTAMVLAAGKGTRMRPLTDTRPKPLITVGGVALLDHVLDRLSAVGVRDAVVNVHYHADQIEAHVAGRTSPKITISDERDALLETGGGLVRARPLLGPGPVWVANADTVWLEDNGARGALAAMAAAWDPERMDALLLLAAVPRSLGYAGQGDFTLDLEGRLARRRSGRIAPFAYMGVQILNLALLDGFSEEPFSLNRAWDRALASDRAYGVRLEGFWMHVGDPASRNAAEVRLARRERMAA